MDSEEGDLALLHTLLTLTCSKSTTEAVENGVNTLKINTKKTPGQCQ